MDSVRFPSMSFFQIPGLTYLTLVGRDTNPTAQMFCFPRGESPAATENLSCFIIGPQAPSPCPCWNKCSHLGFHRHHSSFIVLLLWQRVHTPFQGEGTWDPTEAQEIGGKSFRFSPRSIILSSLFIRSLILSRLSRSRTWHNCRSFTIRGTCVICTINGTCPIRVSQSYLYVLLTFCVLRYACGHSKPQYLTNKTTSPSNLRAPRCLDVPDQVFYLSSNRPFILSDLLGIHRTRLA